MGEGAEYCIPVSPNYVKFSGFYVCDITDPTDNYVNVRKGPGTNYPVVRKVYTYEWKCDHEAPEWYLYKRTKNGWWELYDFDFNFIGYIHHSRVKENVGPEYY